MSAHVILFLCYGFIIWLFRKDMAWRRAGSRALLIPGAWIAIQGSRPVSYWFGDTGGSEANPINTFLFAAFLVAALVVLARRGLNWADLIGRNKPIFLLYAYLLLGVLWSEMPFASAKRLTKDFESLLVALVFLIQNDPAVAIRTIFVRVSYILFPLSVVFIKYFPAIGRSFSRAGEAMFGGVTTQKNTLGQTVFVFGLFILWDLIETYKSEDRSGKKMQVMIRLGMLLMGLWLLVICDSKTSLFCLILGGAVIWGCGRLVCLPNGKPLVFAILISVGCAVAMDKTFGISNTLIQMMGRDPTLTGRTDIWRIVLEQKTDHLVGHGFSIFWDTDKGMAAIEQLMVINSAHNGYLEMYLDGGMIGASLLILFLLVGGVRIINGLFEGVPLARIGLTFWVLSLFYNMSESSFFRLDVLWFVLLLVTLAVPAGKWMGRTTTNERLA